MQSLQGSIALVTGGARGIGKAIALRYAQEGAAVFIADVDLAGAQALAREIQASGGSADACLTDIGEPGESTAMVAQAAARFGRLDLMVNNAGVIRVSRLLDLTPEDWDYNNDVNARGLFFALQAGARQMLAQSPRRC